jgi:hypothetical protein
MVKNFSELMKGTHSQFKDKSFKQENKNKPTSNHSVVKLQNAKDKQKTHKSKQSK